MFSVGEYIIYGNSGVCIVDSVGKLDMSGMPKDKDYYTLSPLYSKGSKVFTPVDNDKIVMRPVLGKQEALELIDGMAQTEVLWIPDEKKRENEYKDAIRTCAPDQMVRIIKTIYIRIQSRMAEGKKITASDEKYFHNAEEKLYGELAVALDMEKDKVKEYVVDRVNAMTTS